MSANNSTPTPEMKPTEGANAAAGQTNETLFKRLMSLDKDSRANTFLIAGGLCLICSLFVSVASVGLRGLQQQNAENEMRVNVLKAAHLVEPQANLNNQEIQQKFKQIETVVIDLKTGEVEKSINPAKYNMRAAAKDPNKSRALTEDPARIRRQPQYATVYLVKENNQVVNAVLPVNGYGLWSTMYGFVSVSPQKRTINGISFYEQQETPGLGGEIVNPKWQANWKDVAIYDQNNATNVHLVKNPSRPNEVDSLAGASLTSRGVQNMINFWLSEEGYQPFLDKLANGAI